MARSLRISVCALGLRGQPGFSEDEFDLGRNLSEACRMLRRAAAEGADLAVLPEVCVVQNHPKWVEGAEPLDGEVVTTLADEARSLGIGVVVGHPTIEGEKLYNSVILLDRDGRIVGVYHKTHPTIWELEDGITPGDGPLVLDTEFGRLGFAICYDLNFAELRLGYRDLAPDLILFASAFRGGLQTRWWAYETRSHLASSVIDVQSVIVNPLGRTLLATDAWTRLATITLNLDCEVVHYDYANITLAEVCARHGKDFDFEWSEPEGVFLVTSKGDQSARSLVESAGWERVEDYFKRARLLRERALSGVKIEKGSAAW